MQRLIEREAARHAREQAAVHARGEATEAKVAGWTRGCAPSEKLDSILRVLQMQQPGQAELSRDLSQHDQG